jgi:hypothetical protein
MKNKHRGSSFDDFLKEERLYEEGNVDAVKRATVFQLKKQKFTKNSICKKMRTRHAT